MAKKLFTVEMRAVVPVWADSEDEAEEEACDNAADIGFECFCSEATPTEWDENEVPFGARNEETIKALKRLSVS